MCLPQKLIINHMTYWEFVSDETSGCTHPLRLTFPLKISGLEDELGHCEVLVLHGPPSGVLLGKEALPRWGNDLLQRVRPKLFLWPGDGDFHMGRSLVWLGWTFERGFTDLLNDLIPRNLGDDDVEVYKDVWEEWGFLPPVTIDILWYMYIIIFDFSKKWNLISGYTF